MTDITTEEALTLLGRKEVELYRIRAERDQYRHHAEELQKFMLNAAATGKPLSIVSAGPDVPPTLTVGAVSATPEPDDDAIPILSLPLEPPSDPPSEPAPPSPDRAA